MIPLEMLAAGSENTTACFYGVLILFRSYQCLFLGSSGYASSLFPLFCSRLPPTVSIVKMLVGPPCSSFTDRTAFLDAYSDVLLVLVTSVLLILKSRKSRLCSHL